MCDRLAPFRLKQCPQVRTASFGPRSEMSLSRRIPPTLNSRSLFVGTTRTTLPSMTGSESRPFSSKDNLMVSPSTACLLLRTNNPAGDALVQRYSSFDCGSSAEAVPRFLLMRAIGLLWRGQYRRSSSTGTFFRLRAKSIQKKRDTARTSTELYAVDCNRRRIYFSFLS